MLLNVFFLAIVLTVAVPVINLAARSFASAKGALQMHGFSLWPSDPTLLNYQVVFSNRLILPSLWNNIVITVLGTAVNLLITLMAAYAVTRPRLVGKKFFMGFFIVMMLFNPGLMPEYLVVKQLKLIDSMWSVILVGAVNVYYLFILRRFIEEVPESLIEAARIDGANRFQIVLHVNLPSILPTVVVMLILRCGSLLNLGFEKIYLLQNPLNMAVSEVISTYSYNISLNSTSPQFSYAAAIGLFTSVINLIVLCAVNGVVGRVSDNSIF